jgi:hypothetical protein
MERVAACRKEVGLWTWPLVDLICTSAQSLRQWRSAAREQCHVRLSVGSVY